MNTKTLMFASAILMGITGIILSFAPQEFATYFDLAGTDTIILQLLGALYFSFALVNWTAKANLMGGIYSRPVSIGNLAHFTIGGLALLKYASSHTTAMIVWIAVVVYILFAILFGVVFYTTPVLKNKPV